MRTVNNHVPVTVASRVDTANLVTIAAAATWDTPAAEWLVPNPDYRSSVLHAWYAILIEHAQRYGQIDVVADRTAAAIWLDRTRPVPTADHVLRRLTGACGVYAQAVLRYERLLAQHTPRTVHWQLAILAAPVPAQAEALLAYRHQDLDRLGIVAQTTSSSREQVCVMTAARYQPGQPFCLPDGGPVLWPLVRAPQPVAR